MAQVPQGSIPPTPSKRRSPVAAIALTATMALAAGGGATAWWLTRSSIPTEELPVGSQVLPQNVMMVFTVSTDAGQWRRLRQFGTSETQPAFDRRLAQWRDRLLTNQGLNYEQHIQPWVGEEVALALLPTLLSDIRPNPDSDDPKPGQADTRLPSLIAVLPIADPVKAQTTFNSGVMGSGWTSRTYEGVTIREGQSKTGQPLAAATLDNRWLVISTQKTALEQSINAYREGAALVKAPGYTQAIARLPATPPFLRSYINLPVLREASALNPFQSLPVQNLPPLQKNQGLVSTVLLEPEGLRIASVGWLSPDEGDRHTIPNRIRRVPEVLPSDTLIMASGGDLQQFWEQYRAQPIAQPASPFSPPNLIQGIQRTTGLEVEKDLLPWMKGEFALALVPTQEANGQQVVGVVAAVQASDRRLADDALKKLDQTMTSRYGFKVTESTVAGQPIINWSSPFEALAVKRGWLDNNMVVLAIGWLAPEGIFSTPVVPLSQNPTFRQLHGTEPQPIHGYFFANVERLTDPQNDVALPLLPQDQAAVVKAIRTLGLTTTIADDRTVLYDLQIQLQKANPSRPLPPPGSTDLSAPDPLFNPSNPPSPTPSPAIPAPSL